MSGPAFPQTPDGISWGKGMTLRDYFAAKAMAATLLAMNDASATYAVTDRTALVASVAYAYADAMLKARGA